MALDLKQWINDLGEGSFDPSLLQKEVIVDARTGEPRQAGADQSNAEWIKATRKAAEKSLYVLCKGILGLSRLTPDLHLGVCNWLQEVPPYRKLYLLPRDCLKTSLARGLMVHLCIQPKEDNLYFPGCCDLGCASPLDCVDPSHRFDGRDTRIVYCGETSENATKQLTWLMLTWQSNKKLKAFWPQAIWDNPRKESEKWSAAALLLRRDKIFPEATYEGIGVGGAITGRHYNVIIKDDIATEKAANSRVVMEDAIEWNRATHALADDPDRTLEFMLGTRWAPGDVWETILKEDPSVAYIVRSIVENGKSIFPEMHSMARIEKYRKDEKHLFPLIRMNSALDPSIADFLPGELREFKLVGDVLQFEEDGRDHRLQAMIGGKALNLPIGTKLNAKLLEEVARSGQRLRVG